jgi:hypothetical protein
MVGVGESAVAEEPSPLPAPNYPRGNFSFHPRPRGEKNLRLWIFVHIILSLHTICYQIQIDIPNIGSHLNKNYE